MLQKTVGELLQEERLKHALSILELSKKTKIRPEYLEALENNQFSKLPAATFVKAYIKIYASVFEFDHEPLLGLLRRDFKESAKGILVPQDFLTPVLKRRQFFTPVAIVTLLLGITFVTILGYISIQWYQLQQPPVLELAEPAEFASVGPQIEVKGKTDQDSILTIDNQPVSLQPDGNFSYEVTAVKEGVSTIVIEARDPRGKVSKIERHIQVQF